MAKSMKNFRSFVDGIADALVDAGVKAGKKITKMSKGGTSGFFEIESAFGLDGSVDESATGGFDFTIKATVPVAAGAGLVTPEAGYHSGTQGRFLGAGQAHISIKMTLVNATALGEGVDAADPDGESQ